MWGLCRVIHVCLSSSGTCSES
uniref:Uncharacterized protein n=1 Tax=Anguilla anguilla TaxID=7936 RepID=A0A0E9T475_ANGAN